MKLVSLDRNGEFGYPVYVKTIPPPQTDTFEQNQTHSILFIEDSEDDYEYARRELVGVSQKGHHNYVITWKKTLHEGLAELACTKPDAILLDLSLPDARGMEAFSLLQSQVGEIPVVILTGLDDEVMALKIVEAGAQDYLIKQLHPGSLARTLAYAIQRQEILHKLAESERNTRRMATAKSEFFASVSHEIRSPLTSIIGYSEALLHSILTPQETKIALSAIFSNGRHLLQVVNDVLDIAKMDAGELRIEVIRGDVLPLLRDVIRHSSEVC